jgi:hypothetical protein
MKAQIFKGTVLSRTVVKNNILRIWDMTSTEERQDWYQEAHDWSEALGLVHELPVSKVCGVVAALSPLKTWDQNLKIARDMVITGDCGHMGAFKNKAINILKSDGSDESIKTILSGNKITSFYVNIMHPDKTTEVTIDRHALSIALGRWITDEDYAGMTDLQYNFFVDCFTLAAKKVGVKPLLMQSATWVKFRKIKKDYRK